MESTTEDRFCEAQQAANQKQIKPRVFCKDCQHVRKIETVDPQCAHPEMLDSVSARPVSARSARNRGCEGGLVVARCDAAENVDQLGA